MWRGMKDRPDLFSQYLAVFKKSTYKKVIKESVTPDLVSSLLQALRYHTTSITAQLIALEGLSGVQNFSLMVSLLPEEDLMCVKEMLRDVEKKLVDSSDVSEEKKKDLLARLVDIRTVYRL